ncbi:hypothetical protein QJS10_CPA09g00777 [Acorus calamus]|uniref:RNase H type-1 domain-containing protein n=1 Tax=Acorus calamus TaxID=4465 RepID=A0AAV9E383_ACOCL|nr:hypothetical protein QJS10_CPA09g00777 [Acorus calamus]
MANQAAPPYYLTAVYASNSVSERNLLWGDLQSLATSVRSDKWILGGDFNEDLRTIGASHTSSNNQENQILCHLDRILVNIKWLQDHADSFVQAATPSLSDHSPLSPLSVSLNKAFGIILDEPSSSSLTVCWTPPPIGWVKSNSDGSKGDDKYGYGAIVRDHWGDCLSAIAVRSSAASINILELKGLAYGLQLSAALPNTEALSVWVKTDSTTIKTWVQGRGSIPWTAFRDLRLIHHLLQQFDGWRLSHIYREGNHVADFLAAARSSLGSTLFDPSQLGSDLNTLIKEDKEGLPQLRITSS